MIKLGVVAVAMGMLVLAGGVAAADLVAPRVEREAAKPWTQLRIEFVQVATNETRQRISVYSDGRVVFDGGREDGAATVARAPGDLLDKVATASTHAPPSQPTAKAEYAVRVSLYVRGSKQPSVHTYDYAKIPASVNELYLQAGALINSPRTPLPCAAWDGQGDFTLTLVSQNFGVAPGPISRLIVRSDGTATDTMSTGDKHETKATPAELAGLRKAAHDVDLGHFTDIYGGAGEGSNLRMVNLKTAAGSCGRAFTNNYPDALKPLFDALTPITARLK